MPLSPKKYSDTALREYLEQEIASTLHENQQIDPDQQPITVPETPSSATIQNCE